MVESGDWYVYIPEDPEGLVMFLEYGTGLDGDMSGHPEGWAYAVNEKDYVTYGGREGFVFDKTPKDYTPYIDENDVVGLTETKVFESERELVKVTSPRYKVRAYYRKRPHGAKTFTYKRKRDNKVFSSGLVATKFIYDTIQDYRNLANYYGEDYTQTLENFEKKSKE